MNKCSQCINCEKVEYTNHTKCIYECRQTNVVLTSEELEEGCKSFEFLEDNRLLGDLWTIELDRDLSNYDLIYALKHMKSGFEYIRRFKKTEDEKIDKICNEHINGTKYYIELLRRERKHKK